MEKSKKKMLLAASVAGLLAVTGIALQAGTLYAEDGVACSGVNACKGQGACAGKDHACAGKNGCKGAGWLKTDSADACTKQGGTVIPTPSM
jgi:hypothetical protein